jgi:hypothetical protein
VIAALNPLYDWVVSHRILAGALLLLGSIAVLNTLINPIFGVLRGFELVDVSISNWLRRARVAFDLVALASLWLIGAAFLSRSWQAYRAEGLGSNVAGRPGFFLKRGAVLLFLAYYGFAILVGDILPFFLFQPPEEAAWYLLASFGTAGLVVGGIAALALIAQLAQFSAQRSDEHADRVEGSMG